jgi:diadenosine tetraphosphate (Ap4A) HIT family hydrolase
MDGAPLCTGADLCDELRGSTDTSFRRTYEGVPPSRIAYRDSRLALLADLSPLTAGHMLLLPVRHHVSFGHVVSELETEIRTLLAEVLPRYAATFGPPLLLEHGSSSQMNAGACVTHAHWHVVPVRGTEVHRAMAGDGLTPHAIPDFTALSRLARADRPYFYVRQEDEHTVYRSDRPLRRQYLRSVLGRLLGIEDPLWDYALVVRKQLLRETLDATRGWRLQDDVPSPG